MFSHLRKLKQRVVSNTRKFKFINWIQTPSGLVAFAIFTLGVLIYLGMLDEWFVYIDVSAMFTSVLATISCSVFPFLSMKKINDRIFGYNRENAFKRWLFFFQIPICAFLWVVTWHIRHDFKDTASRNYSLVTIALMLVSLVLWTVIYHRKCRELLRTSIDSSIRRQVFQREENIQPNDNVENWKPKRIRPSRPLMMVCLCIAWICQEEKRWLSDTSNVFIVIFCLLLTVLMTLFPFQEFKRIVKYHRMCERERSFSWEKIRFLVRCPFISLVLSFFIFLIGHQRYGTQGQYLIIAGILSFASILTWAALYWMECRPKLKET